jgi:hypothetical protein
MRRSPRDASWQPDGQPEWPRQALLQRAGDDEAAARALAILARRAPSGSRWCVARARQEARDRADQPQLRRGARRGSLSWLDRWAAPAPRRAYIPPAVHAQAGAQPVVTAQRRSRRAATGRGVDAPGRPRGGRTGEGRWTLGGSLRRPGNDRGAGRPHRGTRRRASRQGDVRSPQQPKPIRGPLQTYRGSIAVRSESKSPGWGSGSVQGS